MSGSPMSPDDIARLKREVLAAEEAALLASRKVKVDRVKHAAQLQELSDHIATAKTIVANSPVAGSPLKPIARRSPPSPGPSPSRMLHSEKRALDKRLREQQGTDRMLEHELAQLQEQFGDVEEVFAPVGPYEYAACEIVSVDKSHIVLIRKDTKECIECSLDQIMPQDPASVELPANLVDLEYLNQPALLQALQGIWGEHKHQVLCGPNIISMGHTALNDPHEPPEGVNPDSVLQERVRSVLSAAYDDGQMRALICSGLAGSGKSRTAKLMVDTMMRPFDTEISSHAAPNPLVAERWAHTCTILDGFAKSGDTSRCGSFFEVQLDDAPHGTRRPAHEQHDSHLHGVSVAAGVAITCFGLESNQVVRQRAGHRNFNVFYHMCNAYESPELQHLRLRPPETFRWLSSGDPGEADPQQFSALEGALAAVGLESGELEQVWCLLAAVLHLGELTFTLADKSRVVAAPIQTVRTIAGLLSIDPVELTESLASLGQDPNRMSMGARHRPEVMAEQGRDALARVLYDRVFNFLIQRVNDASCADKAKALVSVLDPPGAILTSEDSKGTFQTLLRNYVHERMLHTFTTLMFTNHQTRMRAEGVVPLTELEAPDMTGRIEMLEKKGGLFSVVDEVQSLPQANAQALHSKMVSSLLQHPDFFAREPVGSPFGSPSRQQDLGFSIRHSFGECEYDTKDFLDVDSDDSFNAALRALLGTSSALLLQLFPALLSGDPCRYVNALHMTKTAMVRAQLASLKQMLAPATVMFVHCLRVAGPSPDRQLDPRMRPFDMQLVQAQLDAGCVLPSILWQRFGYPISMPMEAFWDRFFMLSPIRECSKDHPFPNGTVPSGIHALLCLQPFEKHHWRLGHSMVFLRPTPYAILEDLRMKLLLKSAAVITSRIRRQRVFRFMQARKKALKMLQPLLRGMLTRQLFQRALEMAFMSFSDRESRGYQTELVQEQQREAQARVDMAREEEATRVTNAAIEEAHSSEDADLVLMYSELIRSRALNAQWKLSRNPNVPLLMSPGYLEELDQVAAGNEVFAFNDYDHENPISEYKDIGKAAVDAVLEEANFTIADVLENLKEEQSVREAEEAVAEINRNRMQAVDEEMQVVQSELANRKLLTPHEEHAMMSESAASQRIRIRMQAHQELEKTIADAERESTTQQADDNMDDAASALRAILMQGADALLASLDDEDALDPAHIAAQDKLLKVEEGNRFIREILHEIVSDSADAAEKQLRTRTAMAETELRKRDLEDRRAKQDLAMDEERLEALKQAKAFKDKQAAKAAEAEAKRVAAEEEAARQEAEEAEARGDPSPMDVSPRRARFRAERNSEWWNKKKERYEQEQYTQSPGGTLTKTQQSIEDELQSLQALLTMTENASENQTLELLSQEANDKDFKYMFKYKYKALVVDDDNELLE